MFIKWREKLRRMFKNKVFVCMREQIVMRKTAGCFGSERKRNCIRRSGVVGISHGQCPAKS